MSLVIRPSRGAVAPFDSLTNDFDAFVQRVFGPEANAPLAPYAVDVYEDADHLHVDAELPGFTRDEVDVTLDKRVLTITAVRGSTTPAETTATPTAEENGEGSVPSADAKPQPRPSYYLRERRYSRFQRSFSLPDSVDGSSVDAKLTDGVLRLTLNKRQETKPRKINIG